MPRNSSSVSGFYKRVGPTQNRSRADQVTTQVLKHQVVQIDALFQNSNNMRCKRNIVRSVDQKVSVMLATQFRLRSASAHHPLVHRFDIGNSQRIFKKKVSFTEILCLL